MNATKSNRRKLPAIALAYALGVAALAAFSGTAGAQQSDAAARLIHARVATLNVPALEKVFWVCDHTAATRGVDAAPVALCSAVYETLRDQKFGGDFTGLLAWWNDNKPQHSVVASALR